MSVLYISPSDEAAWVFKRMSLQITWVINIKAVCKQLGA